MDTALFKLLADYHDAVRHALMLMVQSGITLPGSANEWVASAIPEHGVLQGGVAYFKHGFGCCVKLPSGSVDFDFGEHGQTNGVRPNTLLHFAGSKLHGYGFLDEADFMASFDRAVAQGQLRYSGYSLYYRTAP